VAGEAEGLPEYFLFIGKILLLRKSAKFGANNPSNNLELELK